jgi:rSAM/selenodomain-associated transferase 1
LSVGGSRTVREGSSSEPLLGRLGGSCAIAVMAKASLPGRTKTRLVPPLSEEEAAELNTVFLRDAADNMLSAAAFAKVSGWMAHSPAGSAPFFRSHLPTGVGLLETVAPTLGECLHFASSALLCSGHSAVCLINADSPTLPVDYLVIAATVLAADGDRIVLGPATDGGYYLVGMKRPLAELFDNIAWSTERVYAQTIEKADALGLPVVELPTWYDVDNAETLQTLICEVIDGKPFRCVGTPTPAAWTRNYLASLIDRGGLRERIDHFRETGRPS